MFNKRKKKKDYIMYEADDFDNVDETFDQNSFPNDSNNTQHYKNTNCYTNYNDFESIEENKKEENKKEENKKTKRTKYILLFLSCYIVFIIIGFISTTFLPLGNNGAKEAQIIDLQLKSDRENYYELKKYYFSLNGLFRDFTYIDQQLQKNSNKPLVYVTSYQNILGKIDKFLPKVKAMNVSTKYEPLKKQNIEIYEDLANYLQLMSSALSTQNNKTFTKALSWRIKSFQDYEKFNENMYDFARLVKLPENDLKE